MTEDQAERALAIGERIAAALEALAGITREATPDLVDLVAPMPTWTTDTYRAYHALRRGSVGQIVTRCAASGRGKVSIGEAVRVADVRWPMRLCQSAGCDQVFSDPASRKSHKE